MTEQGKQVPILFKTNMQIFSKKKKRGLVLSKSKGFTLIELLVVIAIIGILASIVLVSVSGARDRGKDARIIASMSQFRSMAEMINGAKGSYIGLDCNWSLDATALCNDIGKQLGASPLSVGWPVFATSTSCDNYCAYARLKTTYSNATDTYCITKGTACNNIYTNVAAACTTTGPAVGCGTCR